MSQSPHDVLTIGKAAERLEVSVSTLEGWAKDLGFPICAVTEQSRYVVWGMVADWLRAFRAAPAKQDPLTAGEKAKAASRLLRPEKGSPSSPSTSPVDLSPGEHTGGRGIGPAPKGFPVVKKPRRPTRSDGGS